MTDTSRHDSPEVLAHLLTLLQLRDKSQRIQGKINEVTARLQHVSQQSEWPAKLPAIKGDDSAASALVALKELDGMLAQPDLMTRDELRRRVQDLIRRLSEQTGA